MINVLVVLATVQTLGIAWVALRVARQEHRLLGLRATLDAVKALEEADLADERSDRLRLLVREGAAYVEQQAATAAKLGRAGWNAHAKAAGALDYVRKQASAFGHELTPADLDAARRHLEAVLGSGRV